MRRFYKKGLLNKFWIDAYCLGNWHQCVRYQMEAQGRYHPDWMLPDGTLDPALKRIES
jgi:DNA polymerase